MSHFQLGEVTDILEVISNHVCYKTQGIPIFHIFELPSETKVLEMVSKFFFWKMFGTQP